MLLLYLIIREGFLILRLPLPGGSVPGHACQEGLAWRVVHDLGVPAR
jgi:hypothetical protein